MPLIPTGPGWGVEINEDVIRAHPPARPVNRRRSLIAAICLLMPPAPDALDRERSGIGVNTNQP
jgi:hypothetical protein